ncbi:dynein heavy chain, cytosolic [Trypanosoma rangeli]|uniref:Dynein heavy chain, cytosolic n=1 Tax=Trypanosoma rangeli TaxID=5698 RepID=A0A3R7MD42_TRYRA|nr:dynein heavy chain, cytosolic [Trypanosoma rangeli]RNF03623.1 dynein heavy chain, cytosolic [Trypanosoma rangeli]|eukprot:RNF03623.1 dynein heavy chain, cytosolic [Trypanosoma rangeli]
MLWDHVPCGRARVSVAVPGQQRPPQLVAAVLGPRKFGDFDQSYGVVRGTPVAAVALEAFDGESGHVAAFAHDGAPYWLVGTDEVHMLVRFAVPEEDLALWGGGAGVSWRAAVPERVVCVWRDTLRALPVGGGRRPTRLLEHPGVHRMLCGHSAGVWAPRRSRALRDTRVPCAYSPRGGLRVDPASSMKALQSLGLNAVTPQSAVELASGEYAVLQDEVARHLSCKGAVMYGCRGAGVCGADVETSVTRIRNGAGGARDHREALSKRRGTPLEGCEEARWAAEGGASVPWRLGDDTSRLPRAVCGVAACDMAASGTDGDLGGLQDMRRRRCAPAIPGGSL